MSLAKRRIDFESMKIYKRHLTSNGFNPLSAFSQTRDSEVTEGPRSLCTCLSAKINFYTQKRERFYKAWLFSSRKARLSVCALTGKLFRLKPSMFLQYSTLYACIDYA